MSSALGGVDLKLRRAATLLDELRAELKIALDPSMYRFDVEYDAAAARHVYRVRNLPEVDPEWSIRIGEVLFQLRSALDHLAWRLVELDSGSPDDRTQFPIRDRVPTTIDKLMPQLSSPPILNTVNDCQPYGGMGYQPLGLADTHRQPLWHLKKLNNVDKHRLLLVTVCVLDIDKMWWGHWGDGEPPDPYLNAAPLTEGGRVASFDFHGSEPPEGWNPHMVLKIVIREPDAAPALSHTEVCGALDLIGRAVQEVVDAFRPMFATG